MILHHPGLRFACPGLNHQTALGMLQAGDVFVIDGAIRDLEGATAFDMPRYYR